MRLSPWAAALLSMTLLSACETVQSNLQVPESMLTCQERVAVPGRPGERLTDNEIAELMERLEARGDVCAGKLEDLRKWLRSRGAIMPGA